MPTVAINGMGRIGRAALKVLLDGPGVDVAAVNDIADVDNLAYLLRYDTVYGRYHREVNVDGDALVIDGTRIKAFSEADPAKLPWGELGVDLVLECTGVFTTEEDLTKHQAAPRMWCSPRTVRHGSDGRARVNRADGQPKIVSCASCTTNCITRSSRCPAADRGRTGDHDHHPRVHRWPADSGWPQPAVPARPGRRRQPGADHHRAARATTLAVPGLASRFDGVAVRAPVPVARSPTSSSWPPVHHRGGGHEIFREEAASERYRGILGASDDPLVSADIIGDSRAAIVDLDSTQVVDGTLVKVMAWYDNEWGSPTR